MNFKTGRFDNIDSTVIISSVCKEVHTLLMITAESMLSKRPVLRFTVTLLFFLELFSFHIYWIQSSMVFLSNLTFIADLWFDARYRLFVVACRNCKLK